MSFLLKPACLKACGIASDSDMGYFYGLCCNIDM